MNDAKECVWKDYMHAYEEVFTHTSTKRAPWYIIPADNKWFMRLAVAAITYQTLENLDLKYPVLTKEKKQELLEAKKVLLAEKDEQGSVAAHFVLRLDGCEPLLEVAHQRLESRIAPDWIEQRVTLKPGVTRESFAHGRSEPLHGLGGPTESANAVPRL